MSTSPETSQTNRTTTTTSFHTPDNVSRPYIQQKVNKVLRCNFTKHSRKPSEEQDFNACFVKKSLTVPIQNAIYWVFFQVLGTACSTLFIPQSHNPVLPYPSPTKSSTSSGKCLDRTTSLPIHRTIYQHKSLFPTATTVRPHEGVWSTVKQLRHEKHEHATLACSFCGQLIKELVDAEHTSILSYGYEYSPPPPSPRRRPPTLDIRWWAASELRHHISQDIHRQQQDRIVQSEIPRAVRPHYTCQLPPQVKQPRDRKDSPVHTASARAAATAEATGLEPAREATHQ